MALKYLVLALCLQFYVQLAEGQQFTKDKEPFQNELNELLLNAKTRLTSIQVDAEIKVKDEVQRGEDTLKKYEDDLRQNSKQCYEKYLPEINNIINDYRNETVDCYVSLIRAQDETANRFTNEMDSITERFNALMTTTCNNKASCESAIIFKLGKEMTDIPLKTIVSVDAIIIDFEQKDIETTTTCIRNAINEAETDMQVVNQKITTCGQ